MLKPQISDIITVLEPIDNYHIAIGFNSGLIQLFTLHYYTENPKMSSASSLYGHDAKINSISIFVLDKRISGHN